MIKIKIMTIMFISLLNFFGCKEKSTNKTVSDIQINKQIENSIETFLNRPVYENLDLNILNSIHDDYLEQTIIDNIFCKLDTNSSSYEENYSIITALSNGRQAIFATWGLEAEVNNGGFNQYFFNSFSSGQYAEEARDGFRLIGAEKHANLTQRAIDTYMKNIEYYKQFNDGTLESFNKSYENDPLEKIDKEFFTLKSLENLSKLRISYIRKHIDEFIDN